MPQAMTSAQVRRIDPILSEFMHGYLNQSDLHVWNFLFPTVPVDQSGGQVLEFGKEAFRIYNTQRAPGANTLRVNYAYTGKAYALKPHDIESKVPREYLRDAAQVPGIDLAQESIALDTDILLNGLEYEAAQIAQNPNNYSVDNKVTLAGSSQLSPGNTTFLSDFADWKEVVRQKIGRYPNVSIFGAQAAKAAKQVEKVKELFTYKDQQEVTVSDMMLAQALDIPIVRTGLAVYADSNDEFQDVWGNTIVLAYVPNPPVAPQALTGAQALGQPMAAPSMRRPSYGYTYTMRGHPLVEEPYYDNNSRSWIYGASYERAPVLTGSIAGFLVQNVAADPEPSPS